MRFNKRLIDSVSYEAASVFDVNNDGILDIVCGEYWYEGPDFTKKHKICDIQPEGEYYDDFSDYPMDVDGDGNMDIITGAWWGQTLRWRKNPGKTGEEWKTFDIEHTTFIETIRYFDIDGDGDVEIFPNTPAVPQSFFKLVKDSNGKGTGKFKKYTIGEEGSGHGMGFGDLNGNGLTDIILSNGWLENPGDPFQPNWKFHPDFSFGSASVPILVYDVNKDGINDIIVGNAHGYGLFWYEQIIDKDGARSFVKHDIDLEGSQFHDLVLYDIDKDGELELITGKRYRAHNGNDPGDNDPCGVYIYKIKDSKFEKIVLDYGDSKEHSGVGIYFWLADLNGNGYMDIVAPGKEGLYLFENLGK